MVALSISISVYECNFHSLKKKKNIVPMLIQTRRWLMQPKIWRFVGFASAVVGLLCYALSSSFSYLFGQWNLLKLFLYTVFSFIIILMILYANIWKHSRSLRFKAHTAFLVLTITSVYSFFFDKVVNGKPDAYSLCSCASFAIMSLSLSRQTQCGFEVDLLYFFLGCLIVLLMKIKFQLFVVGAGFSYCLIILRSSFTSMDVVEGIRYSGLQDANSVVIEVDSPQLAGTNVAGMMEQLRTCLKALQQENLNLIDMLLKHVKEYLEYDSQLVLSDSGPNFIIDALPSELINDIQKTAELMMSAGFEEELSDVYISCRRKCLEECLINKLFGSQDINIENEDERVKYVDMVIRRWTTASEVALRILFPFEQRLCEQVFSEFSTVAARCFTEVCQGATFQLLNFADAVVDGRPSTWRLFKMIAIFETLRYLIQKFESLCPDLLVNEAAVSVKNRLGEATRYLFVKLNYKIFRVPEAKQVAPADGWRHPTTVHVMSYLVFACRSRQTLEQILREYPKVSNRWGHSFSFIAQMEWIMEKLEGYLIAKSKNYKNLALRYFFMMNNRSYIESINKSWDLGTIFGWIWFQNNQEKIQQDLELYQKSSWNKVLDFLKVDNNEPVAPNDNVTSELLKKKLNLFNKHFKEICRVQSTWCVSDKKMREEIIVSVGNTLLPAYGIFIGRFRDFLGIHANKYIEYGMFEIQDQLNKLFQGNNIDESSEFR